MCVMYVIAFISLYVCRTESSENSFLASLTFVAQRTTHVKKNVYDLPEFL